MFVMLKILKENIILKKVSSTKTGSIEIYSLFSQSGSLICLLNFIMEV